MRYLWDVKDDGLHIYEDGKRVARLEPSQFVHILADLSAHVRWQQVEKNKAAFVDRFRKHDGEG